jgi:hypothetical protein
MTKQCKACGKAATGQTARRTRTQFNECGGDCGNGDKWKELDLRS